VALLATDAVAEYDDVVAYDELATLIELVWLVSTYPDTYDAVCALLTYDAVKA
jgi:hypothetical protein